MPVIKDPYDKSTVRTRILPISPYELYLEQVRSISDKLRYEAQGREYYPAHFGGLKGQRQTVTGGAVIEVLDFKTNGGN